jgi:hypothetical protein
MNKYASRAKSSDRRVAWMLSRSLRIDMCISASSGLASSGFAGVGGLFFASKCCLLMASASTDSLANSEARLSREALQKRR